MIAVYAVPPMAIVAPAPVLPHGNDEQEIVYRAWIGFMTRMPEGGAARFLGVETEAPDEFLRAARSALTDANGDTAEDIQLAEEALARLAARAGEDVETWSRQLADDLSAIND